MSLQAFVEDVRARGILGVPAQRVVELASQEPAFAELRAPLRESTRRALEAAGIRSFFRHQAEAIDAALAGRDVVLATGTNSGKSLAYQVPALEALAAEPSARVLMLFPTKALAQDQLGKLEAMLPTGVRCATYDGDTPPAQRSAIRRNAHVILTNPDMLHVGILPNHDLWSRVLKSLRLVVLDEMHVYRGVFGSHVASVLWRLLRLCEWYGSHPQIVAASATIANPLRAFRLLTGRDAALVWDDASAKGRRTFVFWSPPIVDSEMEGSPNWATAWLLASLASAGIRTLAFSRARSSAEIVLRRARRAAESSGLLDPAKLESYRAGYSPTERREIERALFRGDVLGLSSTNALELGVDVGGLDAVILNGYPGSVASFWQQAGRAGRGARDGLVLFVAHGDALDQFLCREPERLLEARSESVALNPENPVILGRHLLCAAHERPLAPTELAERSERCLRVAEGLEQEGSLRFSAGRFFYPLHEPPAQSVDIRGTGGDTFVLLVGGQPIGTMESWRALRQAHPGAVYLHRDATYECVELDLAARVARLQPSDTNLMTQSLVQTSIEILAETDAGTWGPWMVRFGALRVTDQVVGYRYYPFEGRGAQGERELDLPPTSYETIGLWLEMPPLEEPEAVGALHGLEHALMAVGPLLAGCDRADLGSSWYSVFPDTLQAELFVFDQIPGGVGLTTELYNQRDGWASAATQLLAGCSCEEGCPACLLSPRCPAGNAALGKAGALRLLRRLGEAGGAGRIRTAE